MTPPKVTETIFISLLIIHHSWGILHTFIWVQCCSWWLISCPMKKFYLCSILFISAHAGIYIITGYDCVFYTFVYVLWLDVFNCCIVWFHACYGCLYVWCAYMYVCMFVYSCVLVCYIWMCIMHVCALNCICFESWSLCKTIADYFRHLWKW